MIDELVMDKNTMSPIRPSALTRYLIEGLAGRLRFPVCETVSEHDLEIHLPIAKNYFLMPTVEHQR